MYMSAPQIPPPRSANWFIHTLRECANGFVLYFPKVRVVMRRSQKLESVTDL